MSERFVMQLNNHLQGLPGNQAGVVSWEEWHTGPPHAPTWNVICKVHGEPYGKASASRKPAAREEAARQALLKLGVPV